jgi:hypothetical protein
MGAWWVSYKGHNNLTRLNERISYICGSQTCARIYIWLAIGNAHHRGTHHFNNYQKEKLQKSCFTWNMIIATLFYHIISHNSLGMDHAFSTHMFQAKFNHASQQTQNSNRKLSCEQDIWEEQTKQLFIISAMGTKVLLPHICKQTIVEKYRLILVFYNFATFFNLNIPLTTILMKANIYILVFFKFAIFLCF